MTIYSLCCATRKTGGAFFNGNKTTGYRIVKEQQEDSAVALVEQSFRTLLSGSYYLMIILTFAENGLDIRHELTKLINCESVSDNELSTLIEPLKKILCDPNIDEKVLKDYCQQGREYLRMKDYLYDAGDSTIYKIVDKIFRVLLVLKAKKKLNIQHFDFNSTIMSLGSSLESELSRVDNSGEMYRLLDQLKTSINLNLGNAFEMAEEALKMFYIIYLQHLDNMRKKAEQTEESNETDDHNSTSIEEVSTETPVEVNVKNPIEEWAIKNSNESNELVIKMTKSESLIRVLTYIDTNTDTEEDKKRKVNNFMLLVRQGLLKKEFDVREDLIFSKFSEDFDKVMGGNQIGIFISLMKAENHHDYMDFCMYICGMKLEQYRKLEVLLRCVFLLAKVQLTKEFENQIRTFLLHKANSKLDVNNLKDDASNAKSFLNLVTAFDKFSNIYQLFFSAIQLFSPIYKQFKTLQFENTEVVDWELDAPKDLVETIYDKKAKQLVTNLRTDITKATELICIQTLIEFFYPTAKENFKDVIKAFCLRTTTNTETAKKYLRENQLVSVAANRMHRDVTQFPNSYAYVTSLVVLSQNYYEFQSRFKHANPIKIIFKILRVCVLLINEKLLVLKTNEKEDLFKFLNTNQVKQTSLFKDEDMKFRVRRLNNLLCNWKSLKDIQTACIELLVEVKEKNVVDIESESNKSGGTILTNRSKTSLQFKDVNRVGPKTGYSVQLIPESSETSEQELSNDLDQAASLVPVENFRENLYFKAVLDGINLVRIINFVEFRKIKQQIQALNILLVDYYQSLKSKKLYTPRSENLKPIEDALTNNFERNDGATWNHICLHFLNQGKSYLRFNILIRCCEQRDFLIAADFIGRTAILLLYYIEAYSEIDKDIRIENTKKMLLELKHPDLKDLSKKKTAGAFFESMIKEIRKTGLSKKRVVITGVTKQQYEDFSSKFQSFKLEPNEIQNLKSLINSVCAVMKTQFETLVNVVVFY